MIIPSSFKLGTLVHFLKSLKEDRGGGGGKRKTKKGSIPRRWNRKRKEGYTYKKKRGQSEESRPITNKALYSDQVVSNIIVR
jgi:hypothetical protein